MYLSKIRPFFQTDLVKIITGVRRSGKSVLLEQIRNELEAGNPDCQSIFLNFENLSNRPLCSAEALRTYILEQSQGRPVLLFFDEIQNVKDWELAVNSFRVELNCDIYLTGSNAKLLSGELSTHLAGRTVSFTVYPLSFREYLEINKAAHGD